MKKIILSLATCAIALTSVKAQMAKGNLFMGTVLGTTTYNFGTFTYNYSDANIKTEDQKHYSLSLRPSMGVFLTDHLIFGGTLALSYSHDQDNISNTTDNLLINNGTTNSTTFSVGPFVRYYFFDSQPAKTLFYLQAEAGVGTGGGSTTESTLNTANTSISSSGTTNGMFVFRGGGSLGLTHFIQKNIGLDIGVGYAYDYESYTSTLSTQTTPSSGAAATGSSSYKAKVPQNGITLSAGFHFFIDTKKQ
jgi:hypothetical protein